MFTKQHPKLMKQKKTVPLTLKKLKSNLIITLTKTPRMTMQSRNGRRYENTTNTTMTIYTW